LSPIEAKLGAVDGVIAAAIENRATPGACYAVGTGSGLSINAIGHLSYDEGAQPTRKDTIWDIASLTKVVGTTAGAMVLYDSGDLELDWLVADFIPAFRDRGREAITIRNLLLHNSGLPASHPSPTRFENPRELLDDILDLPPAYERGTVSVYSDVGFIALGLVLEKLTGQKLDEFLRTRIFERLGMLDTTFNPDAARRSRCAPTEPVEPWRQRLRGQTSRSGSWTRGEVHDPTAAVLGGVAGHAGLFSTAQDLARFVSELLWGSLIPRSTVDLFTSRQSVENSRALGWDTPSEGSSAGHRFVGKSFGHTGFTGTSIWADPEAGVFTVLLTNRVHPTATNQAIRELRVAFNDAVMDVFHGE
jgi:CubicO group peptidase (beta-lactamase class C family)